MKFIPLDTSPPDPLNKIERPEYRIEPLEKSGKVTPKEDLTEKKHNQKNKHENLNFNATHFKELTEAVEKAHDLLVKKHIPYRFCIYHEGDEIMIDIVRLDEKGKIAHIVKKDITYDDFFKWIEMIETGDGLIIDEKG